MTDSNIKELTIEDFEGADLGGVDLDNLYSEKEYRLEDQDLRILKSILSNEDIAKEFANNNDEYLFVGDARLFAKKVIDHIKIYKTPPTRRIFLDQSKNDDEKDEIDYIWDRIDEFEFNKNEFKYDLDKIRDRFTKGKIASLKNDFNSIDFDNDNITEDDIRRFRRKLDDAERVKQVTRPAYIQRTMRDFLPQFKEDYINKAKNPELGKGIHTGYSYLDYVTNGLHPAQMLVIAGESASGKALPLDTNIPTPNGFKKMSDIKPGDNIFGSDGKIYSVVVESQIYNDPGWKFTFNDGSTIISHDNHEWLTFTVCDRCNSYKRTDEFRAKRRLQRNKKRSPLLIGKNIKSSPIGSIKTSKEIANSIYIKRGNRHRNNHAFPLAKPIEIPNKSLLIDPYVLGVWLGDGASREARVTTADEDIFLAVKNAGYLHSKTYEETKNGEKVGNAAKTYSFLSCRKELRKINVLKNKHVPHDYLWSSKEQRLALLQGLLDTDGHVSKNGNIEFVNTNKKIIDAVQFLVVSLGCFCSVTEGVAQYNGKITGKKWAVRFTPNFPAFRLKRKLDRQRKNPKLIKFRYLVKAERIEALPMKCIQVSSPDHLFLAGQQMIPTHNSMLLNNMAVQMWMQNNTIDMSKEEYTKGYNVLYFSLEMPYEACFRRTMSRLADLPIYGLRDCNIKQDKIKRLSTAANFIHNYPYEFEIVDIPRGVTIQEVEERYKESVANGRKPDVVAIDYLGLMEDHDVIGDDWLKLGYIAGKVHEFGRVYNITSLTAVQLNRAQKNVKDSSDLIGMHRIGRSSLIIHHADIGLQIESRKDEHTYADLIYHLIKNRDGQLGKHTLFKNFKNATLKDMDEPYIPPDDDGFVVSDQVEEDLSAMLEKIGWYNNETKE